MKNFLFWTGVGVIGVGTLLSLPAAIWVLVGCYMIDLSSRI